MEQPVINIGIMGVGNIGTGVARILLQERELLASRCGMRFNLKTVVDTDWERERGVGFAGVKMGTDVTEIINDPEIDIVIETIGGYEPAFTYVMQALASGKHVITANKALLATKGRELFSQARANGVDILFEASVGGGIPVIMGLREGLVANRILGLYGIVNGTSNYILSRMHQDNMDFAGALKEAQDRGFAEADPTLDINGVDAAHKLAILASLASGSLADFDRIPVEGITGVTPLDINYAKSFGYVIKLLAICRFVGGKADLRVHPTLVPEEHLLAAVNNELNAVFISGDLVGNTMFYGPGAGQNPTASAVVSDIVDMARNILARPCTMKNGESFFGLSVNPEKDLPLLPLDEVTNRFYLRLYTLDQPGILAKISGVLGANKISISSVVQLETHGEKDFVPIVLLTHEAPEHALNEALMELKEFAFIRPDILRLRLFHA
ncbi:MAG TPA: homoserine dehydrogenase [Firmicutes bacterium]|nr:homoserine dehydrogenase [Bacillota bacterium]